MKKVFGVAFAYFLIWTQLVSAQAVFFSQNYTPVAPPTSWITALTGSATQAPGNYYLGQRYDPNSTVMALKLCRYKWTGNTQTHDLYITVNPTDAVIVHTTVNMSAAADSNGYVCAAISASLVFGTEYYFLAGEASGGDSAGQDTNTITVTGVASDQASIFSLTVPPAAPTSVGANSGIGHTYGPINIYY